jgi:hypothetical protein
MSQFTDGVVGICAGEIALFENGKFKEYDKKVYRRVGEYWDELAKIDEYKKWKGYNGRSDIDLVVNGADEVTEVKENENQPWSAAFISWVARTAGAGGDFHYGPSHSVYIVRALKEAKNPASAAKFVARRHTEYTPKVGDLIACERRPSDDANFDTYIDFVKAGRFEAHCDFVVRFDAGNKHAITVGGNVGSSVTEKAWPLDANRRIGNRDPNSSKAGVICIIECRL